MRPAHRQLHSELPPSEVWTLDVREPAAHTLGEQHSFWPITLATTAYSGSETPARSVSQLEMLAATSSQPS